MSTHPDLRAGDPLVHDLAAEISEALHRGDAARAEELSVHLYRLDPASGAGSAG